MKYTEFKKKLEKAFASTTPERLAERLREKGYTLGRCEIEALEQTVIFAEVVPIQLAATSPYASDDPNNYAQAA